MLSCVLSPNTIGLSSLTLFPGVIIVYLIDAFLTYNFEGNILPSENANNEKSNTFKRTLFLGLINITIICSFCLFPLVDFSSLLGSFVIAFPLGFSIFLFFNNTFKARNKWFKITVIVMLVSFIIVYFIVCFVTLFWWIKPIAFIVN